VRTTRALSLVACVALAGTSIARAEEGAEAPPASAPASGEGDAAAPPAPTYTPAQIAAGEGAFGDVHAVLLSPRCANCHPAGDAPLQTDAGVPHSMNITRASEKNGVPCSTCHYEKNAEDAVGAPAGSPPGAPNWHLPPEETPMVFVGRTPAQLCAQLKDPKRNGGKTLAQLLEHVSHDPLVLWGWNPGEGRTTPPLAHDVFVARFKTWVDAGGPCPD
jgi:hypothetical protein